MLNQLVKITIKSKSKTTSAAPSPSWRAFSQFRFRVVLGLVVVASQLSPGLTVRAFDSGNQISAALARYFPASGYTVEGPFLAYWEAHGGEAAFGLPLSDQFEQTDLTAGVVRTKQWFSKALFELHSEDAGTTSEVQLALLGREALAALPNRVQTEKAFAPLTGSSQLATTPPDQLFFKESGHTLAGRFQAYWQSYGGLAQFGYPLSQELSEINPTNGQAYTVQWFERARFELHPEFSGTRYEMELWPLGWQMLYGGPAREQWQAAPTSPPTPGAINAGRTGSNGATNNNPGAANRNKPSGSNRPNIGPPLGYGMNVWLFGQDKDRVLGLVNAAGFSWIRQQVGWDYLEPKEGQYDWNELDQIVEAASRHKLKLILSVVRAPTWAGVNGTSGLPTDPQTYATMLGQMAARYQGKVTAYEVWNEENLGYETGGFVSAARYVELLKAAYGAVKAHDATALVLFGGLSPTGLNDPCYAVDDAKFLEAAYQYNGGEVRNYFDVLGAHAGSAANSPDEFWSSDPSSPDYAARPTDWASRGWTTDRSFYFRRVEDLRAVMERYGDSAKPLWLTEFGWTTANGAPGYEYGALVSEDKQAQYLVRAYQRAKERYPWLGVMAVWNLNFATVVRPNDEKGPWGLIRADWSLRPAYLALQAMTK